MKSLTAAKLTLAVSGLVVWGLGVRNADPVLTYLGIAMLAAAAVLRFVRSDGGER